MCKPKSKCGLGVRDICLLNLVIFAKWSSLLISGAYDLWRDVLVAHYGDFVVSSLMGGRYSGFRKVSSWWKGVSLLNSKRDYPSDRFVDSII